MNSVQSDFQAFIQTFNALSTVSRQIEEREYECSTNYRYVQEGATANFSAAEEAISKHRELRDWKVRQEELKAEKDRLEEILRADFESTGLEVITMVPFQGKTYRIDAIIDEGKITEIQARKFMS